MELSKSARADKVMTEWKNGKSYKESMKFPSKWATYEKFKAGDQWGTVTDRTKALPRPVFNVIDYIESHKISSVMSEQIGMVFSDLEANNTKELTPIEQQFGMIQPENTEENYPDLFTKYSETSWEMLKQDKLNEEALESASNLGTGIWHYYWDDSIKGGKTLEYVGDIKGETLDPMNVVFGNPQMRNVQKQPFIIILSRMDLALVKKIAKSNGASFEELEILQGDKDTSDNRYEGAKIEVDGQAKANVYTKYWKDEETNTVFFTKVCNGIEVIPPTDTELELYPIVVMNWKPRKECIFGIGDTESIIPNQKAINFLLALQLYSVQLTGFPKLLYKKGAINPTQITNQLGEMIQDNYAGAGFGVQYMNPANISPQVADLTQKFMDYTKDLLGAHDAATGQMSGSTLNATAITLLQKSAGIPIEAIKRRFYQAMEDVGRIWEEFWKKKYITARMITLKDDEGNEFSKEFRGSDAENVQMRLKIDIGQSSQYSETFVIQSLDNFLKGGYITFQQYLKYIPKNIVPFKDKLLKELEQKQNIEQQTMITDIINNMNPAERVIYDSAAPQVKMKMIDALLSEQQNTMMAAQGQGQAPVSPQGNMPQ